MRKLYIGLFLSMVFLLSGCFTDDSEEKVLLVYEKLEEVAEVESKMKDLQEPLVEAEEREAQYYSEMTEIADLAELEEIAAKAIESTELREELMEQEKEKIDEGFTIFQEAIPLIEELEEEEIVNDTSEMISIMEERYHIYEKLYDDYIESVELDNQLYEMVYDEEATLDEIKEKLTQINDIYVDINELNEEFNELTTSYNDKKKSLYENLPLNIVFE